MEMHWRFCFTDFGGSAVIVVHHEACFDSQPGGQSQSDPAMARCFTGRQQACEVGFFDFSSSCISSTARDCLWRDRREKRSRRQTSAGTFRKRLKKKSPDDAHEALLPTASRTKLTRRVLP